MSDVSGVSVSSSGGGIAAVTSKPLQPGVGPYSTEVSLADSEQQVCSPKTTVIEQHDSPHSDKSSLDGAQLSQGASQDGLEASDLGASKAHVLPRSTTFSATAQS